MAAVDAMTAALAERLEGVRPSLTCQDVPADGHCQYRAVALQSPGQENRTSKLPPGRVCESNPRFCLRLLLVTKRVSLVWENSRL